MQIGKTHVEPENGELRTRRKLLLIPLTLQGVTRWLEVATIEYKWVRCCYDESYWEPVRFIPNGDIR